MTIQINPLNIRGQIVPVAVTAEGTFEAWMESQRYAERSYEDLRERLTRATRRASARVAVPFSRLTAGRFGSGEPVVRHGIATAIHAARNAVLVRWEDTGKADELRESPAVMRRLTDEEADEYIGLWTAQRDAERALRAFERPRTIALRRAVELAVADEMRKEDDTSGPPGDGPPPEG